MPDLFGNVIELKPEEPDLKAELFGACLKWLLARTGRKESTLRSTIGRWCRDYGDRPTLNAFYLAQQESPVEPVSWIEAKLGRKTARTGKLPGRKPYAEWTEDEKNHEARMLRLAPMHVTAPKCVEALFREGFLDEETARARAGWLFR